MDLFNKRKVRQLKDKIISLEKALEEEKHNVAMNDGIKKRIEHSENYVIKENQKLIDWIRSILENFGTFDVNERREVHIPVYQKIEAIPFHNLQEEIPRTAEEVIVIPEIVIHRRKF